MKNKNETSCHGGHVLWKMVTVVGIFCMLGIYPVLFTINTFIWQFESAVPEQHDRNVGVWIFGLFWAVIFTFAWVVSTYSILFGKDVRIPYPPEGLYPEEKAHWS